MAGSKKKQVKVKNSPSSGFPKRDEEPNEFYGKKPSWNFATCDTEQWAFNKEHAGESFWGEILPKMEGLETQTWREILIEGKKQNHSINPNDLNKNAKRRMTEKMIESEAIISLRLTATHRLYGYMNEAVFNVLWYDTDHGDNDRCVCRSHKKHT